MRDLTRPALADALAAITTRPVGHWRAELGSPALVGIDRISSRAVQWRVRVEPYRSTAQTRRASLRQTEPAREARRVGNTLVAVEVSPAHTITPAEAVEVLHSRGLWPWEPGDERAPAWWCDDHDPRDEDHDTPPSLPALVAVASLGAASLVTSVALAGELAPGAVVVWRVMTREAIVRHHELMVRDGDGTSHAYVFSHEQERHRRPQAFGGQPAWPDVSPWMSLPHVADRWSALRALAVGEGPTPQPTGVHLVALDASRIVLAVEAIGGDRG